MADWRRMADPLVDALRVIPGAVMSSAFALWCLIASMAAAHEVFPSIADMTAEGGRLVFDVEANLESFVAGIDLSQVSDTNEAEGAERYDALRALEPGAFEAAFRAFWPEMAGRITIEVDGARLTPALDLLVIPEVGNTELLRNATMTFSAPLPEGAETIVFGGDSAFGTIVLRQMGVAAPYDGYLAPGAMSDPIRLAGGDQAGGWQTFLHYIPVGFDHIVPLGLDHILFVLGLFFLSTRLGPLVWQVSAFTLAHTITLALAALGYVTIPAAIVEPLIALSIVFVALENIWAQGLSRWRPLIVFGFGLLHGLGFASVLGAFGLPEGTFLPALVGFNIGVEIGQLAVIAVAFLITHLAVRVDTGDSDVPLALGFYGVMAAGMIGLSILSLSGIGVWGGALMDEIPVGAFILPSAALFVLCLGSVQFRDQIDAYRRIVAVPASAAIALFGAWWFVERVLL